MIFNYNVLSQILMGSIYSILTNYNNYIIIPPPIFQINLQDQKNIQFQDGSDGSQMAPTQHHSIFYSDYLTINLNIYKIFQIQGTGH